MSPRHYPIVFSFLLPVSLLVSSQSLAQENAATTRLNEQSEQFKEQVVRVSNNVYTAVGEAE